MAAGTRAGARAHHGRKPAAVSQPVRIPQPDPAAHEAHRVERDVRNPVARGFPCAAALYGAHRLPGAHRAAARRAVSRRAPAAAQGALGRGAAVGAHLVGAVHPGLGDRDAGVARSVRGRDPRAARGDGRAHRCAHLLDRHPPHPVEDPAIAAQYDLFRPQHPRQQHHRSCKRRRAGGAHARSGRGDQSGRRA